MGVLGFHRRQEPTPSLRPSVSGTHKCNHMISATTNCVSHYSLDWHCLRLQRATLYSSTLYCTTLPLINTPLRRSASIDHGTNTRYLLGYGIVQAKGYYMSADPECPAPEKDITKYHDVSALERRKQYVQRLKQRDITPRTD
jgi:hypothetical protein